MAALDTQYVREGKIGDPGNVVKIDECKIGRQKLIRRRMVEGQWIDGMLDSNGDFCISICSDNGRGEPTLANIITTHVEPGTVGACIESS